MNHMRYILPTVSLTLLITTMPYLDWGIVAWVALVPLFVFIQKNTTSTKQAFFVSGLVVAGYFFALLWPLTTVNGWWWVNPESFMYKYKYLIILGTISIGSVYAGFIPGALFGWFYKKNNTPLLAGALWGSLELLRMPFVYDFTWITLAYSQHNFEPILSITPLVSIAGLSGLIVMVNSLFAQTILTKKIRYVFYILIIFSLIFTFSLFSKEKMEGEHILVSSLHIIERTEDLYSLEKTKETLTLIEKELEKGPEILVTPENIFPFLILDEHFIPFNYSHSELISTTFDTLIDLSREYPDASIILGIHTRTTGLKNSMIVLQNGTTTDSYDKKNLLIFGERPPIPFKKGHILPFEKGDGGTLQAGSHTTQPLICSEMATKLDISEQSDFIITIGNDAIFTSPLVGNQNLYISQVQAARHNKYIIRSNKDGVSAIISPSGKILTHTTNTGFISTNIFLP